MKFSKLYNYKFISIEEKKSLDKIQLLSITNYENELIDRISTFTPIFVDDSLFFIKQEEQNFNKIKKYISNLCVELNLINLIIYDREEKYSILNKIFGKLYDEALGLLTKNLYSYFIEFLTVLEYNRRLSYSFLLFNNPRDSNEKAIKIILDTLDFFKTNKENGYSVEYENLYIGLEEIISIDKMALELGLELLQYKMKSFNSNSIFPIHHSNIDKELIVLRAIVILKIYKNIITEGEGRDIPLIINSFGKINFKDIKKIDIKKFMIELRNDSYMNRTKYTDEINQILSFEKGFNIDDIINLIENIQDSDDDFFVSDYKTWISSLSDILNCDEDVAHKIFHEFLFNISDIDIFDLKPRIENRAMRKCIFPIGNIYITNRYIFGISIINWIAAIYTGDISDNRLKSKMQNVYKKMNIAFEDEVADVIKNNLKVDTVYKNILERDVENLNIKGTFPGQIDILFLYKNKIIVIECKNLSL